MESERLLHCRKKSDKYKTLETQKDTSKMRARRGKSMAETFDP
jgi:hypothetical protein